MLTVSNLDKAFGEKQILRSFSYEFPAQGVFCLFGPSGCGKTTLLRIVAGLEQPDAGTVQCEGRLSMVFQEDRLLPWMTAEKNIFITNDQLTSHDVQLLLHEMGLQHEGDKYPAELSGGMKRRIAIARALAYPSDILILDEPFRGLDRVIRDQIMEKIRMLSQKELVLLVTHDLEEAFLLSDRILFLEGKPIQVGNTLDLKGKTSYQRKEALQEFSS